jgi:hypothetical protein
MTRENNLKRPYDRGKPWLSYEFRKARANKAARTQSVINTFLGCAFIVAGVFSAIDGAYTGGFLLIPFGILIIASTFKQFKNGSPHFK